MNPTMPRPIIHDMPISYPTPKLQIKNKLWSILRHSVKINYFLRSVILAGNPDEQEESGVRSRSFNRVAMLLFANMPLHLIGPE